MAQPTKSVLRPRLDSIQFSSPPAVRVAKVQLESAIWIPFPQGFSKTNFTISQLSPYRRKQDWESWFTQDHALCWCHKHKPHFDPLAQNSRPDYLVSFAFSKHGYLTINLSTLACFTSRPFRMGPAAEGLLLAYMIRSWWTSPSILYPLK